MDPLALAIVGVCLYGAVVYLVSAPVRDGLTGVIGDSFAGYLVVQVSVFLATAIVIMFVIVAGTLGVLWVIDAIMRIVS
jgi:hypothetical protein